MDSLLEKIMALPEGARFYRVDLHNHTPFDPHFNRQGLVVETGPQKAAFAEAYVRYLHQDQGIEIVGVTEHNDVSWLSYIQEAARQVDDLIVFPGVEVGAKEGKRQVHYLALFDPDTPSSTIDHFLSSLDLMPGKRFHDDGSPRLTKLDAPDLTFHIVDHKGIPIAAHASSTNGLFQEAEGETRVLAYCDPHLIAAEIPGEREALSNFERQLVKGGMDVYGGKSIACLNHSDGRGLGDSGDAPSIGSHFTYIKLSDMSVEGLRQAFIDHESRVRLKGEYRETAYPRLLGLVVENGFLSGPPDEDHADPFAVRFNPNLNTIIGGRGAGKSALLEAIRYVFDLAPRTEATLDQHRQVVNATLSEDARLVAFYELADGSQYKITRVKGHEPKVYDAVTGEEKSVHPSQILPRGFPIEVYGQKEVLEISKNVAFQRNLLDTYAVEELRGIQRREEDLLRWLETNADDILRLQDDIDRAEHQLQQLEGIRLDVERMEKHEAASQLEKKKQVEREKTLLDRAGDAVAARKAAVADFLEQQEPLRDLLPDDLVQERLPHTPMLQGMAALLDRMDAVLTTSLRDLEVELQDIWQEGKHARERWRQQYAQVQRDYEDLLGQFGEDFSAERYFQQRAKLQALQGIQREMERRRERLRALRAARRERLRDLRHLRRTESFRVRERTARRLTEQLKKSQTSGSAAAEEGAVRVSVTLEGDRNAYAEKLMDLFTGHRIRSSVLEEMAHARLPAAKGTPEGRRRYPDPIHLAQAIRCERDNPPEAESLLAQVYGVSAAYRRRLAGIDEETLYRLETYRIPDRPDIRLRVGHHDRPLTPREGELGLSTGQKCTAILSLILIERNVPLIIDQPEDDLDNEFIFREIVQTLKREKEHRQFIVATHNANIPVSGDAELIIVMQADQDHGWIDVPPGSIDAPRLREPVEDILEGGKEAFRIRQQKYKTWGTD